MNEIPASIERRPGDKTPPNCKYELFEPLIKNKGYDVQTDIDSVYRYFDGDEGKEYFWYHATHKALAGKQVQVTCYTPHVGISEQFPRTDEFLWNKKNLDRISKHFHKNTNFGIYTDWSGSTRGHHSKITRTKFMSEDREKIVSAWRAVKVDVQDLAKEIARATKGSQ